MVARVMVKEKNFEFCLYPQAAYFKTSNNTLFVTGGSKMCVVMLYRIVSHLFFRLLHLNLSILKWSVF